MLNALVNGDLFVREKKKKRGTEIRNGMQDIFFFLYNRVYVFLFKCKYFSSSSCLRTNKAIAPRGYAGFLT